MSTLEGEFISVEVGAIHRNSSRLQENNCASIRRHLSSSSSFNHLDVLTRMQVMVVVEDEHLQLTPLTTKLGYSCSSLGSFHRLDCNPSRSQMRFLSLQLLMEEENNDDEEDEDEEYS
ncbi:hypothetical protein QYF36_013657 [Acer negundo]|nr:hypothetical protein QYF36_013657 [Acer negundo]